MGHRIAPERNPDEHLRSAVRSDPIEWFVLPFAQDGADPIEVVGCHGEVSDSRLSHGGDRAPRVAGDVGDHGGVERHAGPFSQSRSIPEQTNQLLRPTQPGQFIQVHAIQDDLSILDRGEKRLPLLVIEPAQIQIGRPEHFDIPDKARPLRVAGCPFGGGNPVEQVLHLSGLDGGLNLGIANVGV